MDETGSPQLDIAADWKVRAPTASGQLFFAYSVYFAVNLLVPIFRVIRG